MEAALKQAGLKPGDIRHLNAHSTSTPVGDRGELAAVKAGLALPWSNGPTEGNVHRLKMIKRQMYGRSGFQLLRQRVLHHN